MKTLLMLVIGVLSMTMLMACGPMESESGEWPVAPADTPERGKLDSLNRYNVSQTSNSCNDALQSWVVAYYSCRDDAKKCHGNLDACDDLYHWCDNKLDKAKNANQKGVDEATRQVKITEKLCKMWPTDSIPDLCADYLSSEN